MATHRQHAFVVQWRRRDATDVETGVRFPARAQHGEDSPSILGSVTAALQTLNLLVLVRIQAEELYPGRLAAGRRSLEAVALVRIQLGVRASSSVAEQRTFNTRVQSSILWRPTAVWPSI